MSLNLIYRKLLINSSQSILHPSFSLFTRKHQNSPLYGHTLYLPQSTNLIISSTPSIVDGASSYIKTIPIKRCEDGGGCRNFTSKTCSRELNGFSKNNTFVYLACESDVKVIDEHLLNISNHYLDEEIDGRCQVLTKW